MTWIGYFTLFAAALLTVSGCLNLFHWGGARWLGALHLVCAAAVAASVIIAPV